MNVHFYIPRSNVNSVVNNKKVYTWFSEEIAINVANSLVEEITDKFKPYKIKILPVDYRRAVVVVEIYKEEDVAFFTMLTAAET